METAWSASQRWMAASQTLSLPESGHNMSERQKSHNSRFLSYHVVKSLKWQMERTYFQVTQESEGRTETTTCTVLALDLLLAPSVLEHGEQLTWWMPA